MYVVHCTLFPQKVEALPTPVMVSTKVEGCTTGKYGHTNQRKSHRLSTIERAHGTGIIAYGFCHVCVPLPKTITVDSLYSMTSIISCSVHQAQVI